MKDEEKKKERRNKIILFLAIIADIVLIFLILFLFPSCKTVYIQPNLPEYKIENIERPEITEKSEDVIRLMRYAEKKEIQLNNFKIFYENLRKANGN